MDSYETPTPDLLVERLAISREAAELYLSSDVLDLHIESFSFHRAIGYDLRRRHGPGPTRALMFGHADFPRIREAGITGGTWVISTNPLRPIQDRGEAFSQHLRELLALFDDACDDYAVVRSRAEYEAARRAGKHGAFLGIQGGNCFDAGLDELERCAGFILRITLLHLSNSRIGKTSSPARGLLPGAPKDEGLSSFGIDLVRRMNELRIGVDLAHISPRGFWDAVRAHDRTLPILVTHTGVSGVHPHWRNLDDDQLRAIAESGGTVGIMYHSEFLGDPLFRGRATSVFRHLEHVVKTVGDDHVSLGSDWDGLIFTPRDMPTCLELPKLVDLMLQANWSPERIRKVLGTNFLRVVADLRD